MPTEFLAEVNPSSNPQVKIVRLSGELDEMATENLRQIIDGLLSDAGIKNLIFDLSGLRFINSKGIGYLVAVHTHLSKDARALTLVGANEAVMDVISLVGLTSIIPYFATIDEAVASN